MTQLIHNNQGFTLAELLLVVAIIALLVFIGAPVYQSFESDTAMSVTTNIIAQDLYQAEIFSRSEEDNSSWGVAINGGIVTLFEGASYASRNTAEDVKYSPQINVNFSGLSQVVFNKLSGTPQSTGTINLSYNKLSDSVTINSVGLVDY